MPQAAAWVPQGRLGAGVATQLAWEAAQGGQLALAGGLCSQGTLAPKHLTQACSNTRSAAVEMAVADGRIICCQTLAAQMLFQVYS